MDLKVKLNHSDAKIPTRANSEDAGLDLFSVESGTILPGTGRLFSIGISIDMGWSQLNADEVYVALIWDRSGIASKNNVHRYAGVIDSTYRGDVKVYLFNSGQSPFSVRSGDKIAQMLIQKVTVMKPTLVDSLPMTTRGEAGFGSTGIT